MHASSTHARHKTKSSPCQQAFVILDGYVGYDIEGLHVNSAISGFLVALAFGGNVWEHPKWAGLTPETNARNDFHHRTIG